MEKELLNKITDSCPAGIFLYQDYNFVYANKEFLRLWGYGPEDLEKFKFFARIHPDARQGIKKVFDDILKNETQYISEKMVFQSINKNGKSVWVQLRLKALSYQDKPAVLGTALDITDRITWDIKQQKALNKIITKKEGGSGQLFEEHEEELEKTKKELANSRKLAALGKLSGNISHELKNPLAVIDGSARYLKKNLENQPDAINEHIDKIRRNVKKSKYIIESFKDLDNLDSSQFEKLELSSLLQDLIYRRSFPEDVQVETDFDKKNIFIKGSKNLLEIVFKNLIDNAIDAMEGSGVLTIGLNKADDKSVKITFADTGQGMTDEQLTNIFEPSYTTKIGGTGFGLYLVKKIVEAHQGQLEVKTKPQEGSKFNIYLPYYYII